MVVSNFSSEMERVKSLMFHTQKKCAISAVAVVNVHYSCECLECRHSVRWQTFIEGDLKKKDLP